MYKKIKLENTEISYREYWKNNSDVILILHGWWGSSDSWMKVWELLEEKKFRVIIPDIPWTTKVDLDKSYTMENIAELVEKFVWKLGIKEFILWWHSNWWAVSIKLASRWNLDIKKLVLNNAAGIRKDVKRGLKRKILWSVVSIIKPLKNLKVMKKVRELFYRAIGSQDYLKAESNPYLKQTYLNMISSDLQLEMKDIKNDTLLVRWENDTYTPVSDAKKINGLIENSKLIILDRERHGIHLDNPEGLVDVVLEDM